MLSSSTKSTVPLTPRTCRSTSARRSPCGMRSMTSASPLAVTQRVTRMKVSGRYERLVAVTSPDGANSQRPWCSSPSTAPKVDGESNRGRHSQSMLPSLPTSAAVWQSPMSAYSSMRRAIRPSKQNKVCRLATQLAKRVDRHRPESVGGPPAGSRGDGDRRRLHPEQHRDCQQPGYVDCEIYRTANVISRLRLMTSEKTGVAARDRTLELLWRHELGEPQGTRGPKQALSVDQVVDAAIALVDEDGIGALSMRRVSDRLGIGAMSLYTYVPGKAELIDLMIDQGIGEIPLRVHEGAVRQRL